MGMPTPPASCTFAQSPEGGSYNKHGGRSGGGGGGQLKWRGSATYGVAQQGTPVASLLEALHELV